MRLPPSVISLIESHLPPGPPSTLGLGKTASGASAAVLAPRALRPVPVPATTTSSSSDRTPSKPLSVKAALRRFPHIPSIALGAAHRLLTDHASQPGPSNPTGGVTYLLRRQRLYERLLRTFLSAPSSALESERATVWSLWQRMRDEQCPPTLDTLKLLLGTASRHGLPVLPIIQSVLLLEPHHGGGMPEKVDVHLLGLIMKGLVREAGIKPDVLKQLMDDCLPPTMPGEGEGRPVMMDELLVEAYGQAGDMRGMIDTLSLVRQRFSSRESGKAKDQAPQAGAGDRDEKAVLSLYLQALRQWCSNPALRRKRRGSLFPRILTKDLLDLDLSTTAIATPGDSGSRNLPVVWLNGWMNAERISGDTQAAMAIWRLIQHRSAASATAPKGDVADSESYTIYFKLAKQHQPEIDFQLRSTVRTALATPAVVTTDMLEQGIAAALQHHDLPLALYLARRLASSDTPALRSRPTERTVDLFSSGLIRLYRRTFWPSTGANTKFGAGKMPEYILADEWDSLSALLSTEGPDVSLPLSRPTARLIDAQAQEGGDYTATFGLSPTQETGSAKAARLRGILQCLTSLLEKAVAPNQARLKVVMSELHNELSS